MTINLNTINNKDFVTKDLLLEYITDWDIYNFYINNNELGLNKIINSPLRKDVKPSFGLFIGESKEICFKDFNVTSGDCIKFVQLKFGLTYFEALSKIAIDFNIDSNFIVKKCDKTIIKNYNQTKTREEIINDLNTFKLGKKSRNWTINDLHFWNKFGISKSTLILYNVQPISHVFIGDKIITCDNTSYCFIEKKDMIETYKIYQPNNETNKWLNNHNSSIWQGWTQLPTKGDILIITKSLKDVMALKDVCNINAVSLQTEGTSPKEYVINELKSRFNEIYVLYDNDFDKEQNWGRQFGKKLADKFNLIQIEIPDNYSAKDFSDLVYLHGYNTAKECIETLINKPF